MKINLGLVATSLTAAVVMASTDPNAADVSTADEQTFFKEYASNNNMLNGALNSIAELKAEMAAMKSDHSATKSELTTVKSETAATIANLESKHAAEMATVKSETAAKDAKQDAIIASLKAHRHGVVPSNLRRRTQEMSMSMPATANIWYVGGDEEPEENFFEWDDHKESCCDELKGRVSKLEDEVGGVTKCVDYQELYKIDEDSSSKNTCRLGLGVSQVEISGNDRVATRTSMTGRVSISTEDFDVDALESVSVVAKGGTATVEAYDDIILMSKNDIMAHAGNDIQIKADKDVHITADTSSGSVGDVKIAGENVNVDADESVNVAAKEHVMVNAGHNITVKAGDTVTVEADEDVKIAGQDIHIAAEASVDVSAKEHVMVNADDDVKISGDNVDVNAKDDVKIVGGDFVYVVATNASIAMTAGETVTVEADDDVKIVGQDIRVAAEASVDVSAKKNVMVNAEHNVTVMADDTVTVKANDDVKIAGGDSVHIDAHDDIILKSKNDIMAHAENNTVIKADNDVHITADANGGSEGDIKIAGVNVHVEADDDVMIAGGDSVHVKADDDVKIMANNDVIVDAAVDNSDYGNVKIEGVKYFPQKQEICSNDDYETFVVRVESNPFETGWSNDFTYETDDTGNIPGINNNTASRIELLDDEGHLAFGNITVGNGPGDVVVDLVASTGQLFFSGNDYDFDSNLTESSNLTETRGDNPCQMGGGCGYDRRELQERVANWNTVNGGRISLSVELHPSYGGGGAIIRPVPDAPIYLRDFQHVFALDTDTAGSRDGLYVDDAFFIQSNEGSTNPAKLIFPEVDPGDYDVKVRFFVELEAELQLEVDDDTSSPDRSIWETIATSQTELWLGPHYISVSVIDASHEQCGAITWSPTASPTGTPTRKPTSGGGSDKRLKYDIRRVGMSPMGIPTYMFKYREGMISTSMYDANSTYFGAMAQDLLKLAPDAVSRDPRGYYRVDYSTIDVDFYMI